MSALVIRERTNALLRRVEDARARVVLNERGMGTEARLQALINRHEFIVRAVEACERHGLFGQVANLTPVLDAIEDDVRILSRRLGLI